MAEVLLTQAVNEAEEAIESGNYGGAIEACQRILGQFPEFAAAHRIIAEAYAEQGDLEAAREAYQRTLERDPQSIPAHLGLGMLAEEAGDLESALAYVQVAWEIDPRRRDLREHVSRMSQQVYGADGRLYLTRAALASLHFHAGRWDRAVSEAAQVLQEFPSRIDMQVRLAESLWRRGDDEQAKHVGESILRSLPSAVVPLLVLADIHRGAGDQRRADELLSQARDIDPDGVRAADLIMVGLDDQADFLAVDAIPTIDDQILTEEPARYAPAPDFTAADADDIPAAPELPAEEDVVIPEPFTPEPSLPESGPADVQPFRWEELGDEDLEMSDLDVPADDLAAEAGSTGSSSDFSLPTDEELERARPSEDRTAGYTGMLESLDSEGMQPFDPTGGSGQSAQEAGDQSTDDVLDDWTFPTDEELEQARPSEDRTAGYTGMLESLDSEGMQPFDPFGGASGPPQAPDDLPAPPPSGDEQQFDDVFDSLGSEGATPFEPVEEAAPGESEAEDDWLSEFSLPSDEPVTPFATDQPVETSVADESFDSDEALELDDLGQETPFALDWTSIDEEIEDAIPGEMPRGYTDQLRNLDDHGLEPFAFDAVEVSESEPVEETESVPESDELDLDQIAADWAEESAPSGDEDTPTAHEVDSIGVLFEDEFDTRFAETEPLRPETVEEQSPDENAEAPVEENLENLLSGVADAGEAWPVDNVEQSDAHRETELFSDVQDELASLHESMDDVPRETSVIPRAARMSISPERLGLDEELIQRARDAKQNLIEAGRIQGTARLPGGEVSYDSLAAAVEQDPENIEQRISLAGMLLDSDPDEALEHYRWLYRNAPERGGEIVRDLGRLADVMREREMGVHRLIGAFYRRHGDWALAATHYEESLSGRLRRPLK